MRNIFWIFLFIFFFWTKSFGSDLLLFPLTDFCLIVFLTLLTKMLYNRRTVFCIKCTPSVIQKPLPCLKIAELAEHCREGKNHAIWIFIKFGRLALKLKPFHFIPTKYCNIFFHRLTEEYLFWILWLNHRTVSKFSFWRYFSIISFRFLILGWSSSNVKTLLFQLFPLKPRSLLWTV